jgi:hypothetical protein
VLISRTDTEAYAICVGEGGRSQQSGRSPINPLSLPKEIAMKFPRLAIAASFAVLAVAQQVHAEEYQGVLQPQSTFSRSEVRTQAAAAARAPNPYADGASSVVAAASVSSRDRATVQAEARARAHAPNQNLRVEAFADSRVPDYYKVDRAASTRQAGNEGGSALR